VGRVAQPQGLAGDATEAGYSHYLFAYNDPNLEVAHSPVLHQQGIKLVHRFSPRLWVFPPTVLPKLLVDIGVQAVHQPTFCRVGFALELYRDAPDSDNGDYLQFKSGDAGSTGGTLPSLATGQRWQFTYGVSQNTNVYYTLLLDDYAESRTIYSQSDIVQSNVAPVSAATRVTATYVGVGNDCENMAIRWVQPSEQWTATYGDWTSQAGLVKRTRTTYGYDSSGNRIVTYEYGDVDVSGDERSTHAGYAINPSLWILDKLGWTNTYDTISLNVGGTHFIASTIYYYDNQTSYNVIPNTGHGDLTQVTHRWILQGATGTDSSQQFVYDSYGNPTQATDPNNHTTTTNYDGYYHSFPVKVTYLKCAPELGSPALLIPLANA